MSLNKSTLVEKFNADNTLESPKHGTRTVPRRRGSPVSNWQPHARHPADQIQTVLEVMLSGLVCFRGLAFFRDFFDAMVFLLVA